MNDFITQFLWPEMGDLATASNNTINNIYTFRYVFYINLLIYMQLFSFCYILHVFSYENKICMHDLPTESLGIFQDNLAIKQTSKILLIVGISNAVLWQQYLETYGVGQNWHWERWVSYGVGLHDSMSVLPCLRLSSSKGYFPVGRSTQSGVCVCLFSVICLFSSRIGKVKQ